MKKNILLIAALTCMSDSYSSWQKECAVFALKSFSAGLLATYGHNLANAKMNNIKNEKPCLILTPYEQSQIIDKLKKSITIFKEQIQYKISSKRYSENDTYIVICKKLLADSEELLRTLTSNPSKINSDDKDGISENGKRITLLEKALSEIYNPLC